MKQLLDCKTVREMSRLREWGTSTSGQTWQTHKVAVVSKVVKAPKQRKTHFNERPNSIAGLRVLFVVFAYRI